MDKVITTINKIIFEIDNPRNDGWVREHYINLLKKAKVIIDKKLSSI